MRTAPPPIPRDPEFDHPSRPDGRKPPLDEVRFYQRLVVNPFLAILLLILGLVLGDAWGWNGRGEVVLALAIFAPMVAALALQYHCLDCGATGSYHRWRRHACDRVVERWRTPYSAASHLFPSPRTQLFLWAFVLIVGGYLWLIRDIG